MSPAVGRTAVVLSPFSFVKPQFGGPVRLQQIVRNFRKYDWNVRSIAIYEAINRLRNPIGRYDISLPKNSPYYTYKGVQHPYLAALYASRYSTAEDGGWPKVVRYLPARIDVIHVEHPWLWRLAKKIRSLPAYQHALLIFGSANIEHALKKEILDSAGIDYPAEIIEDIKEIEIEAAQEADLVAAVTQSDADWLKRVGARHIVLAPNGIQPWEPHPTVLNRWRKRLHQTPWLLYIASAHLPNITGFMKCLGPALGCIPPGLKLVIVGSACPHIEDRYDLLHGRSLCRDRLLLLGELDDQDLAAVKTLAHGFILPITEGGGSNLKTAEALYSRSYVVGAVKSFRGFEEYMQDFGSLPRYW